MGSELLVAQRWLTSQEVGKILNVDKRTVQKWVRQGRLEALNLGGRSGYRISAQAVEDFLQTTKLYKRGIQTSE
jgi:excisionase family DNA binding protein